MLRVTEALSLVGLIDTTFLTEHGRDRGTAVHETIALDCRGDLDEDSVDPEVRPYLESWRRYQRESGDAFVVLESECEVTHGGFGYVGHIDLIVKCLAAPRLILDLKCGAPARWHRLQLAGYALADADMTRGPTAARGCLYLDGEGKAAKFVKYGDRRDFDLFKAVITLAHFLKGD